MKQLKNLFKRKPEPTKILLIKRTKGQIESIGINRWMVKTLTKTSLIALPLLLAGFFLNIYLPESSPADLILFLAFIGIYIIWTVLGFRAGEKFWKELKDRNEPIDLTKED